MTTHVNDCKLEALQALLTISGGNTNDLEQAWLITEVSTFGHLNDMWVQLFQDNGATSFQFSTAAAEFLISLGYSGNITDMWREYWCDGGGTGAATTFNILDRNGLSHEVPLIILDRSGNPHSISNIMLDRSGNPFAVI